MAALHLGMASRPDLETLRSTLSNTGQLTLEASKAKQLRSAALALAGKQQTRRQRKQRAAFTAQAKTQIQAKARNEASVNTFRQKSARQVNSTVQPRIS